MIDIQVAFDKLNSFECANDLAKYLESEGVKGTVGNAFNCPISNWLSNQTGYTVGITNQITDFYVRQTDGIVLGGVITEFENSKAMNDFVTGFDFGKYPELVDFDYTL